MANKKKQTKAKPKNKGKGKRKQPAPKRSPAMLAMGVHSACSITNPFCTEAQGARWPDNSYTRSVGWSSFGLVQGITADATGVAAAIYSPSYSNHYAFATGTAGGVATYGPNISALFSVPANVARWRLTSWGLSITAPFLTPMTAKGIVRVRLFSPMDGTTIPTGISIASNRADAMIDVPLAKLITQELFVVPMPLGDTARLFRGVDLASPGAQATWNTWLNPGWQVVQVAVSGTEPSAACLEIKTYYNYEFVFADGSDSYFFARDPPLNNPVLQNANADMLSSIGNFVEGTAKKVDSIFQSTAFKYLAGAIGGMMGGPAGAITGYTGARMIKDVD